jgi:hypothetical protein
MMAGLFILSMPEDNSPLTRLTKAEMVRVRFPGMDALVAFVDDKQHPPPAVQEQLDRRPSRWYPKEGGHIVKMPHQGGTVPANVFEIERGGWDHEHCNGCHKHIMTGQECWVTTGAQLFVLCDSCYQSLRES